MLLTESVMFGYEKDGKGGYKAAVKGPLSGTEWRGEKWEPKRRWSVWGKVCKWVCREKKAGRASREGD